MIAFAVGAAFASGFVIAIGAIVATIYPQRHRIAQLLLRGPEWTIDQ